MHSPHSPPETSGLLTDRSFWRLWGGTTASGLATWALPFILGLALMHRTLTATELGIVLGLRTVGFLMAVPIGGVLADRWSRRQVVLVTALMATAATPVIALGLGAFGLGESLGLVAVAAAIVGAGQGACRPAFQALTAEVVTEDRRQQANAAITLTVRVSVLIGPGAAALLSRLLGVEMLIMGTAVLRLIAALLPPRGTHHTQTSSPVIPSRGGLRTFMSELVDGIRETRRHRWFLAGLGALATVIAMGYSVTGVLLPQVSRDTFGGDSLLAGALMAYAAGALLGAIVMARWRPPMAGWAALAGLGCYALAPASLVFPAPAGVVFAAYAVTGLGIELFNVPWFTAIQREIAPAYLARVSSIDFLVSYGLAPLGLALIAPAADQFGSTTVLAVCAVLCAGGPLAAALMPTTRHFGVRHAD